MGEARIAHTPDMTIPGVNGCTGIFIFGSAAGQNFIIGIHAVPGQAQQAVNLAVAKIPQGATLAHVVVLAPDAADQTSAKALLRAARPGCNPQGQTYTMSGGDWEFRATRNPLNVIAMHHT
jgi:hypothetical protein